MGYSAGSLELNLLGYSDGAVTSINNTAKALGSLSRAIKRINETQFVLAGNKLEVLFTKIANATNSINISNINALATSAKSLSSISRIANLERVDFTKIATGFQTLTVAITPFIEKVQSAGTSLNALYGVLSQSSGRRIQNLLSTGTQNTTVSRTGGAFGFLNLARWWSTIYMARRLGRIVANIAQAGADYTETLNLWETSMGTNVTLATEFVNKMNEAYGISEKTLMNAQATFKNMLGGLGNISDQMAYALSEGITQMAVDYASLYNQTFEQAFTKFQSALAGQVRPIRSVSGFDITENTIFQLYQQLGGTKTMRQLNRTEKQLLSILAIFKQMNATGAIGDLNKTMESYANQSRVMAESWQQVKSYAGVLITYWIQQSGLLTYVNSLLIFLGNTLKEIAEEFGAIQHFADPFEAVTDGALTAIEATEQLNGKLLDFDKFRALNESNDTNALGLDEKLLQAFANFDSILAGASMKAKEFADEWKDLSPIIKDIFTYVSQILTLSFLDKNVISTTKSFLVSIFGLFRKISPILFEIVSLFSLIINQFSPLASDIFEIVGDALVPLLKMMRLSLETSALGGKNILVIFRMILRIYSILEPILDIVYSISWVISVIANGMIYVITAVLLPFVAILDVITKSIQTIAELIHSMFTWNWEGLANRIKNIWNTGTLKEYTTNLGSNIVPKYANGGLPDKGTMFVAGEAGSEIVYNTPSGQSGVANIKQIEQAMYNALTRASSTNGGTTVVEIDGQRVFTVVKEKAKSNGYAFSKV